MLALMASFLDPRMKGGVGVSELDKEIIYEKIRQHLMEIAAVEEVQAHPQQHMHAPAPRQQQQPAETNGMHLQPLTPVRQAGGPDRGLDRDRSVRSRSQSLVFTVPVNNWLGTEFCIDC
jgi:hypothetical protein